MNKIKKQAVDQKDRFAILKAVKALISTIYEKLLQISKTQFKKWTKDMKSQFKTWKLK